MDETVMSVGEFVVVLHTRVVKLEQENIELRAKLCALEELVAACSTLATGRPCLRPTRPPWAGRPDG